MTRREIQIYLAGIERLRRRQINAWVRAVRPVARQYASTLADAFEADRLADFLAGREALASLREIAGARGEASARASYQFHGRALGVSPQTSRALGAKYAAGAARKARAVIDLEHGPYLRRRLRNAIKLGRKRGYTNDQIINGVPGDKYPGIKKIATGRPDLTGRDDVIEVTNNAGIRTMREMGAKLVAVIDGPDCGWISHDDPDKADGTIRTMAAALQYPKAHPNCVRAFVPAPEGARATRRKRVRYRSLAV